MQHQLIWLKQKQILGLVLSGQHTLATFEAFDIELVDALNHADYPIDLIIHVRDMKTFPTDPRSLSNTLLHLEHPNLRWVFVVGANKLLKLILVIVCQKADRHVYFYETTEEVLDFLQIKYSDLEG